MKNEITRNELISVRNMVAAYSKLFNVRKNDISVRVENSNTVSVAFASGGPSYTTEQGASALVQTMVLIKNSFRFNVDFVSM